jgi:hypothetical protein
VLFERPLLDVLPGVGSGVGSDTGPSDGELDYYLDRPELYSTAAVRRLRLELLLDPEGGIDEGLVRAVAAWQAGNGDRHPVLRVDGIAGPRTVTRLFPTGLAAQAHRQAQS